MTGDLNKDVDKAVEDFKQATDKNGNGDLSQFIQDLQKDEQARGANDKTFEQAVTRRLHDEGILPKMNIDGTDGQGHLVLKHDDGRTAALDNHGQRVALQGRVERTEAADNTTQRAAARPEDATRPTDTHVTRDAEGRVSKVEYPA